MGSPPRSGSKNGQSNARASSSSRSPAISGGNANRIIAPVARMYQAYSGIRLIDMPGGRVLSTPMISSTAAASEAISTNDRPSSQMSAPLPGAYSPLVSGGHMNQPPSGAARKKMLPNTAQPPIT